MSNLIPAGRYVVTVQDWSTGASRTKGTPFVKVGLKIEEGEHAGRVLDHFLYISENNLQYVAKDFITLGYDGDDPLPDFARAKTHEEVPLRRARAQVVVEHKEFPEGSDRWEAKVKYINPLAEAKPMDASDRATMKAAFAAARASTGKQRAPEPTPIIDDTPF